LKVILSKDDIQVIVKQYYNMDAAEWNDDGTITLDSTLERIVNEKNDMKILEDRLKKKPSTNWTGPYITGSPYTPWTTSQL
jgi:hypothetical protein